MPYDFNLELDTYPTCPTMLNDECIQNTHVLLGAMLALYVCIEKGRFEGIDDYISHKKGPDLFIANT